MRAHRLGRLGAVGARGPGVLTAVAVLVGALALVAAVPGARAANLQLVVTFNANHTISVTLPDGTPVGTTSGPPTVIPAGFYTLTLDDSAVVAGPQFDLQGPGVSLVDNMFYGETASATDTADLAPSSTYTWRDDENPSVVYTFMTSAVVAGGPASPSASGSTSSTGGGGVQRRLLLPGHRRLGSPRAREVPRHPARRRQHRREADPDRRREDRHDTDSGPLHVLGHRQVGEERLHDPGDPQDGDGADR